jgi:Putative beta-barrel porin 2
MDQSLRKPVAQAVVDGAMRRGRRSHPKTPGAAQLDFGRRRVGLAGAGGLLFAGLALAAQGQEAVRMSLAGADAAAAQHRAASAIGYYNLKLGPTAWNFQAGLETDYNSNVNNTEYDPQGDFIFRPQINTRMLWPVTDQNSLNLALGAGYSAYLTHQNLDQLFLTPGTGLSFDVYVGDFWINLHDRISMTENSYQDPTVVGTGEYSQLQNALGTTVTWDLNKVTLKLGYDHVNYVSIPSGSGQPDGVSEVASLSAGYAIKPQMVAGLELGGDLISYTGQNLPYSSARQWNIGGFYDTPVSDYLHCTVHAGYTAYYPESSGLTTQSSSFNGMYAQLDLTHRLNEYVSYTLSGGRMINLAFYSGTVDEYFARLSANWNILRKVTLGTFFSYEYGTYLTGTPETFDRYGLGVSLGRSITTKLSASLGYQFYLRQSDLAGQSYNLNVVSLNLWYAF